MLELREVSDPTQGLTRSALWLGRTEVPVGYKVAGRSSTLLLSNSNRSLLCLPHLP
jgi:hypothetical protein